jgi:hypothetical protein
VLGTALVVSFIFGWLTCKSKSKNTNANKRVAGSVELENLGIQGDLQALSTNEGYGLIIYENLEGTNQQTFSVTIPNVAYDVLTSSEAVTYEAVGDRSDISVLEYETAQS